MFVFSICLLPIICLLCLLINIRHIWNKWHTNQNNKLDTRYALCCMMFSVHVFIISNGREKKKHALSEYVDKKSFTFHQTVLFLSLFRRDLWWRHTIRMEKIFSPKMLAINSICVVTRSHIENSIQETHKNQIHKDEVKRRERYYSVEEKIKLIHNTLALSIAL